MEGVAGRWSLAFVVAAAVAVAACALLRSRARDGKVPGRALGARRSGGFVIVAASVALVFAPARPGRLVAGVLAAVGVAVVGGFADQGRLRGLRVVGLTTIAAVVVAAAGVRAEITGVATTDAVLTVVGIVAVTVAVSGLGNTDGLAALVITSAAAGVFGLAAFGDQDALAAIAAGLAGAALGFLAYNLRPASLFVGQAGGLFAGFVLAVAAVEVRPAVPTPESFAVPLILLALPLADLVVVALGRLRHRRSLTRRRPDHLAHRFVALGWPAGRVVRVMVALQVWCALVAVAVGRGILAPLPGSAVALIPLGLGVFVANHGRVYEERTEGLSAWVQAGFVGAFVLFGAASVPAVLAGIEARTELEAGRESAEAAVSVARRGRPARAAVLFRQADASFSDARDRLHSPLVTPALAVPVLGSNVHAARELSATGVDLARAGVRLSEPVDPERLRVRGGTVNIEEVRRITPSLGDAADILDATLGRIDALSTTFLVAPVRDALRDVERELVRAEIDARRGAEAARLVPAILGADGPRRYFLAVQNPAEQRGAGGFIGNYGILTATDGHVELEFFERIGTLNLGGNGRELVAPADYVDRYGRFAPAETWQNINMSPDLAVVGQVIANTYPRSGGEPVDGVVFVDPVGLAALLELTGPVPVEGWPVPLTTRNVVDVTLRDAYAEFGNNPDRVDFLGDVAEEVIDVATEGDLGPPGEIADVLGRSSRAGHIGLFFTRPAEQALARLINANGNVDPMESDSLLVTNQNAGANKLDYYLERDIDYSLQLDPNASGSAAEIDGHVDVRLSNTAPDNGLPRYVIGPAEGQEDRFVAGENFTYVSVYTPVPFTAASVDGGLTTLEAERELDRNVYAKFLSVFAQSATTLSIDLSGGIALDEDPDGGSWYTLDLVHQPGLRPDRVTVDLEVPKGWRIAEADGLRVLDDRRAGAEIEVTETRQVRVRLEPTSDRSLWDRLHHGG